MPTLCSAYNCKNRCPKAGVGFFRLKSLRKRWIINMKWKDWNPQRHHRVCSDHFEEKYIRRMNKRLHLVPDAVPTIFDFPDNIQKKKVCFLADHCRAEWFLHILVFNIQLCQLFSCLRVPEKVTSSSWYIHVDEEIQMAESLPGFFHSDYCLPHVSGSVWSDLTVTYTLSPVLTQITEAWEWLGMDIRGPLPLTPNGHQYILTLTDFYSKWVEAFPLRSCSSVDVAQHVAEVISHFGFPFGILVRLKRKFTSKINLALNSQLKLKGFSLLYRHRQVGSLDLATQTLLSRMVSDLLKDQPENWDVCLPAKVFSLCFNEHPKTKQRPFSLLCCRGPQPVPTPRDLSVSGLLSIRIKKSTIQEC
uniref:THAP domain-containing protein 1 n=1 Tax=Esox lucius TaxID=8010 RepID=A0A3P9AGF0_ESOLU